MKRITSIIILLMLTVWQLMAQTTVQGIVYYDSNSNCALTGDPVFKFCPVEFVSSQGESFYALTNSDGQYSISLATGQYSVEAHVYGSDVYSPFNCTPSSVNVSGIGAILHIPLAANHACPEFLVDAVTKESIIGNEAQMYVSYMNVGAAANTDPELFVNQAPGLGLVSSTAAFVQSGVQGLRQWNIPAPIPALSAMRSFSNTVNVTQSNPADHQYIYEGLENCNANAWDGSTVEVTGICENGTTMHFTIANTGAGNMSESKNFIIVQDDLLVYGTGSFQLNSGEDTTITVFDGVTNKLIAEQSSSHPVLGSPSLLLDYADCGNPHFAELGPPEIAILLKHISLIDVLPFSTGPITQEAVLEVNPPGICDDNNIHRYQRLEFTLRARNMNPNLSNLDFEMRMPIPTGMDPATFRPGASSETYEVSMTENELVWSFPPQSRLSAYGNADQRDQAVVKFSMKPDPSVATGSIIASQCEVEINGNSFLSNTVIQTVLDSLERCDLGLNEWNGNVSTDWHTAANWSNNLVPNDCSDSALIDLSVANDPVISAPVAIGELTVQGTGTITLNDLVKVCGDIEITGNMQVEGQGLLVGGIAPQSITGQLKVDSLFINSHSTVTVEPGAQLGVKKALTLVKGNLINNGTLTLLSDATSTAYLDDFTTDSLVSYTGPLTIQRYIPTNGYHHMGAAVQVDEISTQLSEAGLYGPNMVPVIPTENCSQSQIAANSPYGNMFQWEENGPFPTECNMEGWYVRSSGPLETGRGYTLNMPAGSTFDLTGNPNLEEVSYGPLGVTNSTGNGLHLVSNPYPCDIEYESPVAGFGAAIYIWQSSGQYPGTYQSTFPGQGTRIASQQAYFTIRTFGSGDYTIPLSWKRTGNTTYFREASISDLEVVVRGQGFADRTRVNFDPMASLEFDPMFDALKLNSGNSQPQLATSNGYELLSANSLNPADVDEIPLLFETGILGEYKLEFSTDRTDLTLEDRHLKTWHSMNQPYNFRSTENDENRFFIHVGNDENQITQAEQQFSVWATNGQLNIQSNDEISVSIDLIDMLGRSVYSQTRSLQNGPNRMPIPALNAGAYLVRIQTSKVTVSEKVIIH